MKQSRDTVSRQVYA